jgi:hypothetical protein
MRVQTPNNLTVTLLELVHPTKQHFAMSKLNLVALQNKYEHTYQSQLVTRRSSSRDQPGEGSQIERGTSPVDPEFRLLTKITCQYPHHSPSITIKWLCALTLPTCS